MIARRIATTLLVIGLLAGFSACDRAGVISSATITPTPGALPTMTPTPTSASTPTITLTPAFNFNRVWVREAFNSPAQTTLRAGNEQGVSYRPANGGYIIAVSDTATLAWSPVADTFSNAAISVDARLERGALDTAAGILFRYQDDDNFYLFSVAADGNYALALLRNGTWTPMIDWTTSPFIAGSGKINRLRVEAAGERIRLYVNGTLLDEASDATFATGGVALAVHTFDVGNARVWFDQLVIQVP